MKIATLAALLLLAATSTAATAQPLDRRHDNQQQRIDRGIATGALTPGEARHLDAQQGRIDRSESRMRYRNGGHLTRYQRAKLQRRENMASRNIYRKKHNGRYD